MLLIHRLTSNNKVTVNIFFLKVATGGVGMGVNVEAKNILKTFILQLHTVSLKMKSVYRTPCLNFSSLPSPPTTPCGDFNGRVRFSYAWDRACND